MKPKLIVGIATLLMLLAGCAPISQAKATETANPIDLTADPSATATTSGQLPNETCFSRKGGIESHNIQSKYYDQGITFRVYTPPCYAEKEGEHFPVLYLIHGQGFDDGQWDRIGADEAADKLIGSGEASPFIIVMPYDNYSLRPTVGLFDEAFLSELVPWIDENYRTLADREHRAIGGLSRGASWAIHFALTEPDLFGAMGGHSPPVFIEEARKVIEWLDAIPPVRMPRFWLDIGDGETENIMSSAEFFESLLAERNIPHEWHIYPGDHSEEYWSAYVEEYLRWYAADW
ncbi:MAG TPA: alpha/beta hydrolase-fold protein [Anaerolineales bacterium]|jgi:enterochelin esterase-like enzyme|nr:alpha/beta hydrolase-fold protein [Anaerolineales bacterium]